MGRRGRRIRKLNEKHKSNNHHLLWPRHDWNTGYAYLVRHAFTREIPVSIHDELHQKYLTNIPRPSEAVMQVAWEEYQEHKQEIDEYDICRAIAWLYVHVNDARFRAAMQTQLDFFVMRLG